MKNCFMLMIFILIIFESLSAQVTREKFEWENGRPEGCTTILVGKLASDDGSVMTSHTDDSHRSRAQITITQAKDHPKGAMATMYKRIKNDSTVMPTYKFEPIGEIPQVAQTYKYFNTAYPCMNEYQLAIGESTIGGRDELKSDSGLIDCTQLNTLIVQRCKTAREAIAMAGVLLNKYGWNDYAECLTIADPKEVWMLEIYGPGASKVGAVWAAQRVPDDHISINANASRIQEIDLDDPDNFLASENIFTVAKENGWWDKSKEFKLCYVYDPDGRTSFAARRREWRVLSMAAPSLNLNPNGEVFPFSVKPDEKISKAKMVEMFSDYYEGTDFDMRKTLLVKDKDGKAIISPRANPFMHYDMLKMLRINGGWGELGERTIARWYTMYATITQSRDWLPDEVGGVVWFALDNVATSVYVPLYTSITDLPESYKMYSRKTGYTRESAWWAFNRLSTIAGHRWGEMRHDIAEVWQPMQSKLFADQPTFEKDVLELIKSDKEKAIKELTKYSMDNADKAVNKAWKLGDKLWTKYDEKW